MTLDELKPHIQSRLAHELKGNFLESLSIDIKNRLLGASEFVLSNFHNSEIANQISPKLEPDVLMDELFNVARANGHNVVIKETIPKGHFYTHLTTSSCNLIITRRSSRNVMKSLYFTNQATLNQGLVEPVQPDLLDNIALLDDEIPLSSLLFVYASIYWDRENQLLDFELVLPHPTEFYSLLTFTLDELRASAKEPMTDIAEDDIVTMKRRVDQAAPKK
ncbi:hypothetical protein ABVS_2816 [Acinetobacter lwoffii]|uniref:hypothetical protein n=1 Tax=Acinetobacter TaxID=469 RepID=UPI00086E844E|nr:hypothetical protein [Acinetobacter lwoffii]ODN54880.1 hypothetical protein A9Z54_07980 [Acinetobacter sp. 51m]QZM13443.1 hypothetical protein ABVS_2816 [Acinetobacter lwoffii]